MPGHSEAETATVWNGILQINFPLTRDYATAKESGAGGVDLITSRLYSGDLSPGKRFLVVHCEASAPPESLPSTLSIAATRLWARLESFPNNAHRKFGVIAVGRSARFYEVVDGQLLNFHHNGATLLLDEHCEDATKTLQEIRDIQENGKGAITESLKVS